ncbi:RING-H2 finger protein ATL8-like [Zingiber officinale]|uniref:RING-H2 finger protein ATL8-like n=1 Tax=Zingiber officinale TaxID=94328 RepID=UPI001C4AED59|nr:RING-H2 finger protein ATL8-like [Zingiber officinale]
MRSAARFLLSSDPTGAADQSSSAFPFHSNVILTFAALLCALICALGLAFVARCAWLRRSLAAHADRPLLPALPLIPRKGIKQKTLRALPTLSFAASSSSSTAAPAPAGVELVDCAICLAEFACGDLVRVLPQCGHGFHAACVDTWLGSNASCPSCRRVVVVPAPPRSCRKCGRDSGEAPPAPAPAPESGGASTSKSAH